MPSVSGDLPLPPSQATVTETVAALRRAGYRRAYGVQAAHVCDAETREVVPAGALTIDALYRFEGESDPADEAIVVALRDPRRRTRGVLVAAYGPAATAEEDAVMADLVDGRDRS